MAPPDWTVGNGNDRYGPGPIPISAGGATQIPYTALPSMQPEQPIYDDAGNLNEFNAKANSPESRRQRHDVQLAYITTFEAGHRGIIGAADDPAPGQHGEWGNAGNALYAAAGDMDGLLNPTDWGVKGSTASAIKQKAAELQKSLHAAAAGARRMDFLVDMFSRDISRTKEWFKNNEGYYNGLPKGSDGRPTASDQLEALNYATEMTIRGSYNPPIDMIRYNHPDLPPAPQTGGTPTPPATTAPNLGGGGGPGGSTPGGLGLPTMPAGTDPSANQPSTASPASALSGLGNAANAAGDAAQKAGQSAQQAGQNAAKAAQGALGNLLNGKKGPGGLPEGTLGLGPRNPAGATKAGGAGGGTRGGAGASGRAASTTRPTPQLAQASKAATATSASRAGLSSSAGGAGAGSPAAGHRGGAGADKVHKASKALRHNHHDMLAEGDAVMQVLGEEPAKSAPAKPT